MKKMFLLCVVFGVMSLSRVSAQFEGTIGMGIHAGYGAEINSPGVGLHLHYYQTNNLRFVPSFTYFAKRKGIGMWMAETDIQYVIPVSVTASLYPIAGIHYSNWKYGGVKTGEEITGEWEKHRPGVNLGLGYQHDISYRVRANFELKYQFIKDYSQVFFMTGFGFWL
ncbi:MAG: outer membrane beta-barrel protein [Porphyromonadaceae bacterium]|nr:outer membrane beta-barrel protein [Porphyromonadaceae bacterium]